MVKNNYLKLKLFFVFIFLSLLSFAQQNVVTGIIYDSANIPLVGANILVKGTDIGVLTDFDGKFSIEITDDNSTLVISYLGFETKEVDVKNTSTIEIVLEENASNLEEVVVVGYGTQKVKDITGAVATFDGESLAERRTTQVSTALQGSIAGVTVSRGDGNPGSGGSILIRGVTSLGNSQPLVLVDGVPSTLGDVSPDDIANISVLKDAASAAIYGSRAAAGVIIVTTKRAKKGKARFSYNLDTGIRTIASLPEFADAETYMRLSNEMRANDGQTPDFTEDEINNWVANNRTNPDEYPLTDWNQSYFKSSALQTRHNVTMSIGTEKLRSNASVNWFQQDALTPNRFYKRLNMRLNNNYDITDRISGIFDVNYKRTIQTRPARGRGIFSVYRLAPIWDDFYEDGRYAPARNGNNPIAESLLGGNRDDESSVLGARIGVEIEPVGNLKLKAIVAPRMTYNKRKTFSKVFDYTALEDPDLVLFTSGSITNLRELRSTRETLNITLTANYDFSIGEDHKFTTLLGFEDYRTEAESITAGRDGFDFVDFPFLNSGSEEIQVTSGSGNQGALRSFFGRLIYSYKDRYHFQANNRYDGSSRFTGDNKWGLFPSVAFGWTVSEEPFWENIFQDSYLKFRASWGRLGNQDTKNGNTTIYNGAIGSFDLGQQLFINEQGEISSLLAGGVNNGFDPNLTWETTESTNLGIDLKVIQQKLSLTADVYKKNTYDLLFIVPDSRTDGLTPPITNVAEIETYGWDGAINWRDSIEDFKYHISFNMSDSRTEVIDLKGTSSFGNTALIEGEEFRTYYGYRSLGFLTQEDLDNNIALVTGNEQPGDLHYEDISGPDGIPDGKITPEHDRVPLEGSRPRYNYGGNIGFDYKGFDFNATFQGVAKRTRYYSSFITRPFIEETGNIPIALVDNTWSPERSNAAYPRLSQNSSGVNYRLSDFWLRTGAYFRLSNVTVGYTIPKDITQTVGISNLRFYLSANDMWLATKFPKGYDPEINNVTDTPLSSLYMFGVNVKF